MYQIQTFLRQKITLASSEATLKTQNERHTESGEENDSNPSSIQETASSIQLRGNDVDLNGFNVAHRIRTSKQCVKESSAGGSDYTKYTGHFGELNSCRYEKTDANGNMTLSTYDISESKSLHSPSKVRKSSAGAGVLRYALQLRFVCPFPKKCSRSVQRCKADPSSEQARNKLNSEGERRFYLYNDFRVVFPQRQTDSDEGKVHHSQYFTYNKCVYLQGIYNYQFSCYLGLFSLHSWLSVLVLQAFNYSPMNLVHVLQLHVEYQFPSDPRYFDISN